VADRQDSDREVLTSLPRSRPVRRSAKRAARPDPAAAAAPKAKAKASSAGASKTRNGSAKAKPAAAAQPKAAAKPRAAGKGPARPPRKIPPAGYASPSSHAEDDRISGSADLVGNAVQAAGELAQIGFAVGRQALQSMIDRLPKP
jgi:chemotaxis protein histidine kinase CheA